jgi:uncharacterized protein (TIGR00297 family)
MVHAALLQVLPLSLFAARVRRVGMQPLVASPLIVSPLIERAATWPLALAISAVIALGARRAGSLTNSGALAALAVGAIALSTTWGWGAYLIAWFVLASVLSRIGRARKAARVGRIVAKGERRDAWQVLANGGVFAAAAVTARFLPAHVGDCAVAAAAALAAAGADTWATEIGTLLGGAPWSLRLRRTVAAGTSGAVSWAGTLGSIAGALVLAVLGAASHMTAARAVPAVVFGAIVGVWTDTALGAWWQVRYWCPTCSEATEQELHCCGMRSTRAGGIGPLDNDAVNLACTVAGAAAAMTWQAVAR